MNVYNAEIAFAEIPYEISLVLNITGCPYKCEGCHSPHLWVDQFGTLLDIDLIKKQIDKYGNKVISCITFMGGDWNPNELIILLKEIKDLGYKTALYSGKDEINYDLVPFLDYYKIGKYDKSLGGLDNINTNQKLFVNFNNELKNITNVFWRKHSEDY